MSCIVANTEVGEGLVIDGRFVLTLERADGGHAHLAVQTALGCRELDCAPHETFNLDELVSVEPRDVSAGAVKLAVRAPRFVSIWPRDEYPDRVPLATGAGAAR